MYTIQSPSYITIVMDAAFYLCAIRATDFVFTRKSSSSDFMSAGTFSRGKWESRKELYIREFE